MEMLIAWVTQNIALSIGGSIVVIVLPWILKKIPTEKIRKAVYNVCFTIGKSISAAANSWKVTKPIWENALEPWLIGFLDMVFVAIPAGLFDGLRSDNDD